MVSPSRRRARVLVRCWPPPDMGHQMSTLRGAVQAYPRRADASTQVGVSTSSCGGCVSRVHLMARKISRRAKSRRPPFAAMTCFPDDVWQYILALRPRDRDASSPTAAALREGIRTECWDDSDEERPFGMYIDLDSTCPWCGECPTSENRWYFNLGMFKLHVYCQECQKKRTGSTHHAFNRVWKLVAP